MRKKREKEKMEATEKGDTSRIKGATQRIGERGKK